MRKEVCIRCHLENFDMITDMHFRLFESCWRGNFSNFPPHVRCPTGVIDSYSDSFFASEFSSIKEVLQSKTNIDPLVGQYWKDWLEICTDRIKEELSEMLSRKSRIYNVGIKFTIAPLDKPIPPWCPYENEHGISAR